MPDSIEDQLIVKYQNDYPGIVFKEVAVGELEDKKKRRIDVVLIEGKENRIFERGEFDREEISDAFKDEKIHLIEAKKNLGCYLIGQVEVGEFIFDIDFDPEEIVPVALSARNNLDIKKHCDEQGIKVQIYDMMNFGKGKNKSSDSLSSDKDDISDEPYANRIDDIRNPPAKPRFTAFKGGWKDAVEGNLYSTIETKKTHANMGNLFGWIYGGSSDELKKKAWEQYIENNREFLNKDW